MIKVSLRSKVHVKESCERKGDAWPSALVVISGKTNLHRIVMQIAASFTH